MKKKILTFVMALCLIIPAIFALTGCKNEQLEKYAGKYVISEYSISRNVITREEYLASPEEYDNSDVEGWFAKELSLNSDGTFLDYQTNVSFGLSGTWSVEGQLIVMKIDGTKYMTLLIDSRNSLINNENDYTLTFTKI